MLCYMNSNKSDNYRTVGNLVSNRGPLYNISKDKYPSIVSHFVLLFTPQLKPRVRNYPLLSFKYLTQEVKSARILVHFAKNLF